MPMRRTLLFLIFVGMAGWLAWHHITDYRESAPYTFDAPAGHHFTPPFIPLLDQLIFADSLELYIVGGIDRGTVTISSDAFYPPLAFSAGEQPTMIAHARMGEFYQSDVNVTFEPSEDARCWIRVIYRFRGLY